MPVDLQQALQREGAQARSLPPRTRCAIAVTIAAGQARAPELAAALDLIKSGAHLSRIEVVETILQSTLFFGFPRAVTAFGQLESSWPRGAEDEETERDPAPADPGDERAAGIALFEGIYASNADSVRAMLTSFSPTFHDFVIESAYGRVLARPALEPQLRELCAVAALSVLEQTPQLIAHARGALRFGASEDALRESLWMSDNDDASLFERIVKKR